METFDLTPDQASKFNRALKGESVDLTPDEVTQFNSLASKLPKQKPGFASQALDAAKNLAGGVAVQSLGQAAQMVNFAKGAGAKVKDLATRGMPDPESLKVPVPRREDYPSDENFRQAMAMYPDVIRQRYEAARSQLRHHEISNVEAALQGLDLTGVGVKAGKAIAGAVNPQAAKGIDSALASASEENPVTEAATGFMVPMPGTAVQRIGLMGASGLIKGGVKGGLTQGALAAGMEAFMHGAGKLAPAIIERLRVPAATEQMMATLGKEGPVWAKDLEQMLGMEKTVVGGLAERGTVPSFEVGAGTASGPLPGVGTVNARPGPRGEVLTDARTPRSMRETMAGQTQPGRPDMTTNPNARALRSEGEKTFIMEEPGQTNPGRRVSNVGETNPGRPYYEPGKGRPARNEAPQARGVGYGRQNETFVGPVTAEERATALAEAGKTRLTIPNTPESIEAAAAEIERLAAERGNFPRPQDAKAGQFPGTAEPGHTVVEGRTQIMGRDNEVTRSSRAPNEKNLPAWAREEMVRRGIDPKRTFNDVDLQNPSIREAIRSDPTLAPSEKARLLGTTHPTKFEEALQWAQEAGNTEGTQLSKTSPGKRYPLNPAETNPKMVLGGELPDRWPFNGVGGGAGSPEEAAARARRTLSENIREPNPQAAPKPENPVDPVPLQPSEVPGSFAPTLKSVEKALRRSRGEDLVDQFILPVNRANGDVAAAIRFYEGAVNQRVRTLKFRDELHASIPKQDRARVEKLVASIRDRRAGVGAVDQLPPEFKKLFVGFQREQQHMTMDLARSDYYTPSELASFLRTAKENQLHLHRSYEAFMAKGSYKPPREALDEAARFISETKGVSYSDALGEVHGMMKRISKGEVMGTEAGLAAAFRDSGITKERKLPPQLRKLMGVVNDPAFVVADSLGEVAQLYHLKKVTENFAQPGYKGVVWSDVPDTRMDPRKLWMEGASPAENKRAFGEFAGKFVAPELYAAMANHATPEARSIQRQVMNAFVGWFQTAKTLLAPVTWTRDLLSNSYNLRLADVPYLQWGRLGKLALLSLRDAGSIPLFKGKTPTAMGAKAGEWARMALEDGGLLEGRATDWGGSEARRIIENAVRGSPEGLVGVADRLFKAYNYSRSKLGKARELTDALPRLMAYIYHVEQGAKLGMPELSARARASQLVNRWFATGANVGPALRQAARSGAGPFMGWFVDNLRVHKNIAANAGRGDLGPLLRAALHYGLFGVAPFAVMRAIYGVTDNEVQQNNENLKGSVKERYAIIDWLPVRGKDKAAYAVSVDPVFPFASFLKMPDPQHPARSLAGNLLQGMISSGALEAPLALAGSRLGLMKAPYQEPTYPGDEGYSFARSLYDSATPGLLQNFATVTRKAQLDPELAPLQRFEDQQTLPESLVTTFNPLKVEKVGERHAMGAKAQKKGLAKELNMSMNATKKMPPGDRRDRIREETRKRAEELRKK